MVDVIPFPSAGARLAKARLLSDIFDPNCSCEGCREFYSHLDRAIARKKRRDEERAKL